MLVAGTKTTRNVYYVSILYIYTYQYIALSSRSASHVPFFPRCCQEKSKMFKTCFFCFKTNVLVWICSDHRAFLFLSDHARPSESRRYAIPEQNVLGNVPWMGRYGHFFDPFDHILIQEIRHISKIFATKVIDCMLKVVALRPNMPPRNMSLHGQLS